MDSHYIYIDEGSYMMFGITAILFWAVTGRANWYHGIMHNGWYHGIMDHGWYHGKFLLLHPISPILHLTSCPPPLCSTSTIRNDTSPPPLTLCTVQRCMLLSWLTTIHGSMVDNNPWYRGWQQSGWFSKRHSRIAAISSDNPILLSEELIALTSTATVM